MYGYEIKHPKPVGIYKKNTVSNLTHPPPPPRQNGRHFADDIFICIFVNEKLGIVISLKFVPHGPVYNKQAQV